jgi:uncharacterized protein YndB with AHSA1/START domain
MDIALKPAEQELVITRDFKAPRERVFAAWTDPRQAGVWWAPQSCTPLSCEMDVRPGGLWRRRMRMSNGAVITKYGVYREVVAPERLVFTYGTDFGDGAVDPETLVSVTLADHGGGTRLTLRHWAFQSEVSRLDHEGGWVSTLVRFAAFVAAA